LTEILRIVLPAEFSNARYLLFGLLIVLMMRWRPAGLLPVERE
jgi:branched-chain amino acid transport system permease protein